VLHHDACIITVRLPFGKITKTLSVRIQNVGKRKSKRDWDMRRRGPEISSAAHLILFIYFYFYFYSIVFLLGQRPMSGNTYIAFASYFSPSNPLICLCIGLDLSPSKGKPPCGLDGERALRASGNWCDAMHSDASPLPLLWLTSPSPLPTFGLRFSGRCFLPNSLACSLGVPRYQTSLLVVPCR